MNIRELKPLTNLLNNPKKYLNSHFKLIFTYPILFTNGTPIHMNMVRDFVSHYYLKELVVSNSLHILSQVRSIETNDMAQQIANSAVNQQQQYQQPYFNSKYEYQEAVDKITDVLNKYLQIDPLYSKFRPALHTILVPDNLITIPVIVGTKALPMDLLLMCTFLLVAAIENITLDRPQNVDTIIQHLKNYLKNESFSPVLGQIIETLPPDKNIPKIKFRKIPVKQRIQSKWNQRFNNQQENQQTTELDERVIKSIFTSIDQFAVHWKMVLDNILFQRKFGLSINPQSQLGTKIVTRTEAGIQRVVDNATKCLNTEIQNKLIDLEITIFNFFQPINSYKNLTDVENDLNNNLLSNLVSNHNDVIVKAIANGVSSLSHDTSSLVVIGEKLLEDYKKDVNEFDKKFEGVFQYRLTSNSPQDYDYAVEHLVPKLDSFLSFVTKGKVKYEQIIASKFDSDLANYLNEDVYKTFKSTVSSAVRGIYNNDTAGYVEYLKSAGSEISNSELDKSLTPIIYETLYYRYLLCLVGSLGDYLYKSEVEFEISSGEITDFPNYTLAIPLEVLEVIHSFLYIRDFKRVLKSGNLSEILEIQPLTARYIKDVIRYLTMKLRVPNIFAVDIKKNTVYYKFMNQTEVNNVNIKTIENFIDSVKNI